METRAALGLGLGPDPAAVSRDDAPHVGQPDAVAGEFGSAVQALEHTEKLAGVFHIEPGAVVGHREDIFTVALTLYLDRELRHLAPAGVLDRIADQVLPHGAQHVLVADHDRQRADLPLDAPFAG